MSSSAQAIGSYFRPKRRGTRCSREGGGEVEITLSAAEWNAARRFASSTVNQV